MMFGHHRTLHERIWVISPAFELACGSGVVLRSTSTGRHDLSTQSSRTYDIRLTSNAEDWPLLRSFYREQLRPNHPLANITLFDWCFGPRPLLTRQDQGSEEYSVITARESGRIIGHIGAIEVPFRTAYGVLRAAWYINIFVIPEFRRSGVASALLLAGLNQYDLIMGLGTTEDGLQLYRRHGYTRLGFLHRYIRVLDITRTALLLSPDIHNSAEIDANIHRAGHKVARLPRHRFRTEITSPFVVPAQYTLLWNRFASHFQGTVDRSPDYLAWRFGSHPELRYSSIQAYSGDGTLAGFLVFRLDAQAESVAPVVRIVDLIADEDVIGEMLIALEAHGRALGAAIIEYFCSSEQFALQFEVSGYLPSTDQLANDLCRLYHPVRPSSPIRVPLSYKLSSRPTHPLQRNLRNPDDWYVTLADSDLDRLQR